MGSKIKRVLEQCPRLRISISGLRAVHGLSVVCWGSINKIVSSLTIEIRWDNTE